MNAEKLTSAQATLMGALATMAPLAPTMPLGAYHLEKLPLTAKQRRSRAKSKAARKARKRGRR